MGIVTRMFTYDEYMLQRRMAGLGFNYRKLAKAAGVDPKTAKSVVLTGRGQPESIQRIAAVLKFSLDELVVFRKGNGKRTA